MVRKEIIGDYSTEYIKEHLSEDLKDLPIYLFEEIDSTNSFAMNISKEGKEKTALIISDSQAKGRGRIGHSFFSPKGNGIYMSYLFTRANLSGIESVTTKVAVCVCKALSTLYEIDLKIKWVNDIYYGERKICGILTEANLPSPMKGSIVVGIGINFKESPLPDDLKDIVGFLPYKNITRSDIVASIMNAVNIELSDLEGKDYADYYKSHSYLDNKEITFLERDILKRAYVIGISDDCGLIVKEENGKERILKNGEVNTIKRK